MAFCSNCGAAQPEGAKFCTECGAPIANDTVRALEIMPQTEAPKEKKRRKRKPLYRRWWFWVVVLIVIVSVFGKRGGQKPSHVVSRQAETVATEKPSATTQPEATPKPIATAPSTAAAAPAATPVPETTAGSAGVSPEFKATMDSYEAFFDEYIAFMKAMSDDPTNAAMLLKYAAMMVQYSDTMEKLEAIDESKLSPADDAYYIEVIARINVKLLQASQYMQ